MAVAGIAANTAVAPVHPTGSPATPPPTDTVPILATLLALFHTAWLIPYAVGTATLVTTGTKYNCPQGNLLVCAAAGSTRTARGGPARLGPHLPAGRPGLLTPHPPPHRPCTPQRAANYGVLILFVVAAVLEWSIAAIGLRGATPPLPPLPPLLQP